MSSGHKPPTSPLSNSGSLSETHSRVNHFQKVLTFLGYTKGTPSVFFQTLINISYLSAIDLACFIRISPGICLSTRLWLPFGCGWSHDSFLRDLFIFSLNKHLQSTYSVPSLMPCAGDREVNGKEVNQTGESGTGSQEWHFGVTAWLWQVTSPLWLGLSGKWH